MKYVKGVITTQDSNVILEIPSDWKIKLMSEKFLVCKNVAGNDMAYNTNHIVSIGELDEQLYKNTLTRIELERQRVEGDNLKKTK